MNIQEEIFRSIESLAKKDSFSAPLDIPTVILGAEGENKFRVKINGADRIVKNGIGLDLKVGDAVWCHAMNGNIGELYIISRR